MKNNYEYTENKVSKKARSSNEINVMELPCYISLSNKTVKHGQSTKENIVLVSNKINDALSKNPEIEFNFTTSGAFWDCIYLSKETNIKNSFTINLWEREGDLLIETILLSASSFEFSTFYKSLLAEII